jgi:hypothetical protein
VLNFDLMYIDRQVLTRGKGEKLRMLVEIDRARYECMRNHDDMTTWSLVLFASMGYMVLATSDGSGDSLRSIRRKGGRLLYRMNSQHVFTNSRTNPEEDKI